MEIAHWQLHFWEEPPISGMAGSGTVFFAHCNLKCPYCQNYAISSGWQPDGRHTGEDSPSFEDICLTLQSQGAMNINLVTPTHYAPSVRAGIEAARDVGLEVPIVWNTSSYETVGQIRANRGLVDVYLADMKYADGSLAGRLSGYADYPETAMNAIEAMVENTAPVANDDFNGDERLVSGVIVRHMLIPGQLDDSKRVVKMLHRTFGDSIRMSLMNQYTPVIGKLAEGIGGKAAGVLGEFPDLARPVTSAEYEELLEYADALGVEDYFWQDGHACSESFIPEF